MLSFNESWYGKLMTVKGLIDAEDMGFTDPHEHLLCMHQGPKVNLTSTVDALEEMQRFYRQGGRTIIDMTTGEGLGRQPKALKEVSEKSSVNIVMGTGFYKDAWLSPEIKEKSTNELFEIMVTEIIEGEKENGIHAGVIGEVGISRTITKTEERILVASAKAHQMTGAAINVHFDIGTTEPEYTHVIGILENEGADLNRVILDHFTCRPDEVGLCKRLTDRGCYVEFDLFGQEIWTKIYDLTHNTSPEVQIASIKWFICAGMIERILIAQDVGNRVCLRSQGGYGYTHIQKNVIPRLKHYGISEKEIKVITEENPMRLFPFQKPKSN